MLLVLLDVEDLTKGRQALQLEAVYFITPSASSVNHLLEDYSGDKPLYTAAHVYFSSKISSENLSQIKDCRKLVSKLKTLKEVTYWDIKHCYMCVVVL